MRAIFRRFDVRVTIVYAAVSILWVTLTETLIDSLLINNLFTDSTVDIFKGVGFITVTSLALFVVMSTELRKRLHVEQALERDSTKLRRSEAAQSEMEAQLRIFVEHAPAAIAMLDTDMKYLLVSRRWLSDYRLSESNVIGRSHYEIFPDLPEHWREIHQRCLKGAVEKNEADTFPRADGTLDWVQWEIRPWQHDNSDIGGIFIFSELITERKQAEAAIHRYAQRMEILHEIDQGIIGASSIQGVVDTAILNLRKLIPCQLASLTIQDETTGQGIIFTLDLEGDTALGQGDRIPVTPELLEMYGSSPVQVFDDIRLLQNSNPRAKELANEGLVSALLILLMDREHPIGSLGLFANTSGFFTPEYQEIAAEVANQLSIAIHQMHLTEELAQHTDQLEQMVGERTADLIAAKRHVEGILNNSADGILLAYSDFTIRQANAAFNRLFGCQTDDYFDQPLTALFPVDEHDHVTRMIRQGAVEGQPVNIEVKALRHDGTAFDAEISVGFVKEISVGFIKDDGMVCTIRDITESKKAQAALQQSAAEIHDLYNNAPCGYHSLDENGVIVQMNDTELRWLGYSRDEVVGKLKITDLYTPNSQQIFREQFPLFKARGWVSDLQLEVIRKDGSIMHILMNATAIYDEQGQFLRSRSTLFDITDLRQAQQAFVESEARYRLLAENVTDVIGKTNPAGIITFVTPSCYAVLGYAPGELIGKPSTTLVHPEDVAEIKSATVAATNLSESSYSTTHRIRHKAGHYFWVEVTTSIIRDPNTLTVLEYISVMRDITERKQAEDALKGQMEEAREFQAYLKALHEITIELTQIDDLDAFYKHTVESGLEKLGFERLALFLYDEASGKALGTYGTDPQGKLSDERHVEFTPDADGIMLRAFERTERFYFRDNVPLYDDINPIGVGWNAAAVLWNGTWSLGWLVADSFVTQSPATKPLLDTLALYALTVGTLLAQKQIQIALQESESRYRLLAENITDVVVRVTPMGVYHYVSPSAEVVLGYQPQDVIGKSLLDFVHPDDISIVKQRSNNPSRELPLTYRFRHKDGHYIWIEVVRQAIRSQDEGEVTEYIASARDISDRKRAEDALRESEERFRQIAENFDQIIFIRSGDDQKMLYTNPMYEKLTGRSLQSVYENPNSFVEAVHPEDLDYVYQQMMAERYTKEGFADFEYRLVPHRQPPRWVRVRMFPIKDDGAIVRRAGIVEDITERKRIAAELESQRAFLRNVIDVSPSVIFVKDYDSRFVLANPMLAQMYDTTVEDLIGKRDADFNHSIEEIEEFLEADRHVITSGESLFIEEQITNIRGQTHWYQTTKVPIVSGDGKAKYVLGIATDITERKRAEDTLRQALENEKELGELKSRLVSMASHEFRTPLASILSSSEILARYRTKMSSSQIDEKLDSIARQVNHLNTIVEDVLNLGRIESGRIEFHPVEIDFDQFCRDILDEFQNRPDVSQSIIYKTSQPGIYLWLDQTLMRQVFTNLISNAIKYSPFGRSIWVNLDKEGNSVVLSIHDEGIGIPEADLNRLFQPFHRANNVGTISGTGLGLAITKEAVELHGGTINVKSKVGVGTTFFVRLPLES